MVASFLMLVMVIAILPVNVAQAAIYQKGSKGTNVQYLQQNLNFLGFYVGEADGNFGSNTRKMVVELQKNVSIADDRDCRQ